MIIENKLGYWNYCELLYVALCTLPATSTQHRSLYPHLRVKPPYKGISINSVQLL